MIFLASEDMLCAVMGRAVLREAISDSIVIHELEPAGGASKLVARIEKLNQIAKTIAPVVVIADGDQDSCVVRQVHSWLPKHSSEKLFLRLAVRESESWLLADHEGVAEFFKVNRISLPRKPELIDAKEELLKLVKKSARRQLREEMLPSKGVNAKTGLGYNLHACDFIANHWSAARARENAPSLDRTIRRLSMLKAD